MTDQPPDAQPPDAQPPNARPPRRGLRRWTTDDDLLAGLDRDGRPHGLRPFFAITIALSLTVWQLAFALGAYHTVFYSRLFQILVVSSVLLIGSVVLRHDVKVRLWMRVLLAVPLIWLVVRFLEPFGNSSRVERGLEAVLVGMTLASVPFTLWAVARIMAPEFFVLRGRRLKAAVVTIVVLVAVTGFLVGQFNNRFTSCQDYVIAGDDEPATCQPPPPPPPSHTAQGQSPLRNSFASRFGALTSQDSVSSSLRPVSSISASRTRTAG